MPSGEDFLTTFYRPSMISTETKSDDAHYETR